VLAVPRASRPWSAKGDLYFQDDLARVGSGEHDVTLHVAEHEGYGEEVDVLVGGKRIGYLGQMDGPLVLKALKRVEREGAVVRAHARVTVGPDTVPDLPGQARAGKPRYRVVLLAPAPAQLAAWLAERGDHRDGVGLRPSAPPTVPPSEG
jgi:hypothetical protein